MPKFRDGDQVIVLANPTFNGGDPFTDDPSDPVQEGSIGTVSRNTPDGDDDIMVQFGSGEYYIHVDSVMLVDPTMPAVFTPDTIEKYLTEGNAP